MMRGMSMALAVTIISMMAGPAVQAKDYGSGFSKFYSLGLPDVTGMEYVKLNAGAVDMDHFYLSGSTLKGNAWLQPGPEEGPRTFIIAPARTVEVWNSKQLKEQQKREREAAEEDSEEEDAPQVVWHSSRDDKGRIEGSWSEADYEADLSVLTNYLWTAIEEESEYQARSQVGKLFLHAAQAYRLGYTNEANKIVSHLTAIVGDPRKMVLAGLSALADAKYQDVLNQFNADKDWDAFVSALDEMRGTFRVGWQNGPAIDLLRKKVRKRLSVEAPPPIPGEGLTEEDQQLAEELASLSAMDPSAQYQRNEVWLLSGSGRDPFGRAIAESAQTGAVERIKARGVKSIPLLMAMLDDDYLLPVSRNELPGGSYTVSRSYDSASPTEEQVLEIYANLPRPAERSDLARRLLQPLIVGDEDSQHRVWSLGVEDVRAEAQRLYEKLGSKNEREIASFYIKEGYEEQRSSAVMHLASLQDPDAFKEVEAYLMESIPPEDTVDAAHAYVKERGPAAREFGERYLARFEGIYDIGDQESASPFTEGEFDYDDWQDRQNAQKLIQIRSIIHAKPLDEMLADIAQGRSTVQDQSAALTMRLQKADPNEALAKILDLALSCDDPLNRYNVLLASRMLQMQRYMGGKLEEPLSFDLAAHADKWRTILTDELSDKHFLPEYSGLPLRYLAAPVLEALYGEQDARQFYNYYYLGQKAYEQSFHRAMAILDDVPEEERPPSPDMENVDEDEVSAFTELLKSLDAAGVHEAFNNASLDLLLAVQQSGAEGLSNIAFVADHIGPVDQVYTFGSFMAEEEAKARFLGKKVTRELVQETLEFLKAELEKGNPGAVSFARQPLFQGVHVTVWSVDERTMGRMKAGYMLRPTEGAAVLGYSQLPGARTAQVEWPLSEAVEEEVPEEGDDLLDDILTDIEEDMLESEDASRDGFWNVVEKMYATESFPTYAAGVSLIAVPESNQQDEPAPEGDDANE